MPLGETGEDRVDQYLPLSTVRPRLQRRWTLQRDDSARAGRRGSRTRRATGGSPRPAQRIGFITPLTEHFCDSCNRVRLTCTGTLFLCLGQEDHADLRTPLRDGASDEEMEAIIRAAVARKPKAHDFIIDRDRPPNADRPSYEHDGRLIRRIGREFRRAGPAEAAGHRLEARGALAGGGALERRFMTFASGGSWLAGVLSRKLSMPPLCSIVRRPRVVTRRVIGRAREYRTSPKHPAYWAGSGGGSCYWRG